MVNMMKLYKKDEAEAIKEAEQKDGAYTIELTEKPGQSFEAGAFQVSISNENGESEKVDVPAFTMKDLVPTSVSLSRNTIESADNNITSQLTIKYADTAANVRNYEFTYSNQAVASIVNSKGEVLQSLDFSGQENNGSDRVTVAIGTNGEATIDFKETNSGKTTQVKVIVAKPEETPEETPAE